VAVRHSVLPRSITCHRLSPCVAALCSALQCVAVGFKILQCVAECCRVLQSVAECHGGVLYCNLDSMWYTVINIGYKRA